MSPYTYIDLDEKEIRLLTLLPSCNFDDPIQITIAHVPFAVAATWESHPKKPPLEAIRKTLPKDREIGDTWSWDAAETPEGRTLYSYWDDERDYFVTTWTHPTLEENGVPHNDSDLGDRIAFQPTYEALSYAWGSAINPETAYVERQETTNDHIVSQSTLELGQNLATALRHLRYLDKPRVLWVDAICIDQQNNPERDQQVQRMREIYMYADRVVVWLGLSSEKSALALRTLEHIGNQVEVTRNHSILPSPDCTVPHLVSTVELPFDEGVWQAILDILERPWFERVWIVQEIQLGSPTSVVQCGEYQISWYLIRRAISRLWNGAPENVMAKLQNIAYLVTNLRGDPLPTLLQHCNKLKCSDPLDKIYGILGLAPPLVASKIHPSYEFSAPEAYKTTFLRHLDTVRRLELLDHCHTHSQVVQSPSWVPDWSVPCNDFPYRVLTLVSSGCSAAHYQYTAPKTLEVVGVQCFKIKSVFQPQVRGSKEVAGSQEGLDSQEVPGSEEGSGSQERSHSEQGLDSEVGSASISGSKDVLGSEGLGSEEGPDLEEWSLAAEVAGLEEGSRLLSGKAKLQRSVYPTGESLFDAYVDVLRVGTVEEIFDFDFGLPTLQDAKESLLDELSKYLELSYDPFDIPSLIKSNKTFVLTEDGYFGTASEGVRQGE
jgi:hypothetical protein